MFEMEGVSITEPKELCPECLSRMDFKTDQEQLWIYCQHNAVIAAMEINEGKPTGTWEVYSPVDPVADWVRKRKGVNV